MKKILNIMVVFLLMISLVACSSKEQWNITINSSNEFNILQTDEQVIDYVGNKSTVTHKNEPSNGMKYVVLSVTVKEVDADEQFDPMNISLSDGENTYPRLEDSFLATHNYTQLRTYSIQFGEESGQIAFEVPSEVSLEELELVYNSDSMKIEIPVK